jgi:hypothetical protein
VRAPEASRVERRQSWAYRSLLLLELGWNMHRPYVSDGSRPWLGEGMATLGLRFDISLLP